jgi:hypothetical protein
LVYSPRNKTFTLPVKQIVNMHSVFHKHYKETCIFCSGNSYDIAEHLKTYGIDIFDVAPTRIIFKAEKNYPPINGGTTDETNLVLRLVLGLEKLTNQLNETEKKCPECNKTLSFKYGKRGYFIGCTNYPVCKYSRSQ